MQRNVSVLGVLRASNCGCRTAWAVARDWGGMKVTGTRCLGGGLCRCTAVQYAMVLQLRPG